MRRTGRGGLYTHPRIYLYRTISKDTGPRELFFNEELMEWSTSNCEIIAEEVLHYGVQGRRGVRNRVYGLGKALLRKFRVMGKE